MSKDYRNTSRCPILSDVSQKKDTIEKKIQQEHKKARIIYNFIKDKYGEYFKGFSEVYNFKCAYCGASLQFTDKRLFEIDHFVCESAYPKNTDGRAEAGKVKNLVFSCYSCNRGKGNLQIQSIYQTLLNPDDNSIASVFSRDEGYYIRVNDVYSDDKIVKLFYEKLMLDSEVRRLDFLLLEMSNLIIHLKSVNKALADKIEQCMGRLLQKKNLTIK